MGITSADDFKRLAFTIKDIAKYDINFVDNLIVNPKGMVAGKIPLEDFQSIRTQSLHNIDTDTKTLLLGKYEPTVIDGVPHWDIPDGTSYNIVASNNGHMYFDLGADWEKIVFSHNPLGYLQSAIVDEWEYIKAAMKLTDNNLELIDGLWTVTGY